MVTAGSISRRVTRGYFEDVLLVVDDVPVVVLHPSVGRQSVGPDLSQSLGEVVSLLNHWPNIILVVASFLH